MLAVCISHTTCVYFIIQWGSHLNYNKKEHVLNVAMNTVKQMCYHGLNHRTHFSVLSMDCRHNRCGVRLKVFWEVEGVGVCEKLVRVI